jgi:hypothetical protein
VGATAADLWTPLATTRIATSRRPQVKQAVPAAARMILSLREIGYELPPSRDGSDGQQRRGSCYRGSCGSGSTEGRWPTPGHPTGGPSWAREP